MFQTRTVSIYLAYKYFQNQGLELCKVLVVIVKCLYETTLNHHKKDFCSPGPLCCQRLEDVRDSDPGPTALRLEMQYIRWNFKNMWLRLGDILYHNMMILPCYACAEAHTKADNFWTGTDRWQIIFPPFPFYLSFLFFKKEAVIHQNTCECENVCFDCSGGRCFFERLHLWNSRWAIFHVQLMNLVK